MTGRQCRVTARNTTQVATATTRIAVVAPRVVKIRLQWVKLGVRWAANQCGIVRSPSSLPFPSLVTSSPIPTMTPRISTQATRTPAAIAPRWRTGALFMGGSGWGGLGGGRASGCAAAVADGGFVHGGLRLGRLEVGSRLRFHSFGKWIGHRLARGLPGQLEGECGDAEPGDPDRPRAYDVGQVVDAEQDPADPNQGNESNDHGGECGPPPAAGGGQEDEKYRAVADDRAERVAAREAVPGAVGDRMRHHRAQPADQRFEDRVQDNCARARDEQVDR